MFIKRENDGIIYYASTLLESEGFANGFFARYGGVSKGDFESLNVSTARLDSFGAADSKANVLENYRRALSVIGSEPERAVAARQVHSADVLKVTGKDGGRGICPDREAMPDADALLLDGKEQGVDVVCVKTADCVPILLANKVSGSVCAVHAGWRGSAADIAAKAAKALSDGDMDSIIAAIGPCIGLCCYEVGGEVVTAFRELFTSKGYGFDTDELLPLFPSHSAGGKRHADLAKINARLLEKCGVRRENIDAADICTSCYKDEKGIRPFFSHRAQSGHSGTFVSAVRKMQNAELAKHGF